MCARLRSLAFLLAAIPAWLAPLGSALADPVQLCRDAIAIAEREHAIPPGLLQAIGRVESGRRDPATGRFGPWPWTIHAEGRGMFFPSREAAIAEVRRLQAQGTRSIDIGCLQVNLRHHPDAFASLEEGFDPVANARYAARFLTELRAAGRDWQQAAAHYHSQTADRAEIYRARVMAAWAAELSGSGGNPVALAALAAPAPRGLSNGAERAQIIPMAAGARGRGLDDYRQAPIMLVGRPPTPPAAAPSTMPLGRVNPLAFFRTNP